ncbi:hypothetical protein ACFQ5C_26335, partial [Methylobacterium goesingense]
MVEGPGRFGLAGLLVWIASLVVQPALATAAPLDRGAFAAALCGDGAAQTRSVESFLGIASEAETSDVAWAGTALRALLDRRFACLGETALLLDRAGAAAGVDAATGAARPAA